jgi:hypothetical protein
MENFLFFTAISVIVSVIMTFFYIKLTGKNDKDLNKKMFQSAFMVAVSNVLGYWVLQANKEPIATTPFHQA